MEPDVAEIVGVDLEAEGALERSVVPIRFDRGLVTTGMAPIALLFGSLEGALVLGGLTLEGNEPLIQRQIHIEVQ